jgi:hypothetical protein
MMVSTKVKVKNDFMAFLLCLGSEIVCAKKKHFACLKRFLVQKFKFAASFRHVLYSIAFERTQYAFDVFRQGLLVAGQSRGVNEKRMTANFVDLRNDFKFRECVNVTFLSVDSMKSNHISSATKALFAHADYWLWNYTAFRLIYRKKRVGSKLQFW